MGREGKEAGSISPASLDLGDGIWARSDLGPPAQRPAWQAVVFVQGRTGWGWKQARNAGFGQTDHVHNVFPSHICMEDKFY
jgi:hypothetical protein